MSTETHSVQETTPGDILRRVDEAVCALDDDWQFTFVNDRAAAMLENDPADLLGATIWNALPDIEESVVGRNLREAMETQIPVRFDHYNDTLERWFKVRLYPSEDGVTACFYDITDERGEQLDLQRQQRLFETVFDETAEALVVVDTDKEITRFNQAAQELLGYDTTAVVGKTPQLFAADSAEPVDWTTIERGETDVVEYERADGTTFHGETLRTEIDGPDGDTLAFLVSIENVTARVAREQERASQRTRLRALFDESPNSIIVHDIEGTVIDANDTQLDSLGIDREECLSMNVAEFEVGISQSELRQMWTEMSVGDLLKTEGTHRRQNGTEFPVEVWVNKAEVGGSERFIAVSRDITERKQREHELKRNQELIEKTQESASIGWWEIDLTTGTLNWSDEVYRIHDLPTDATVGVEEGIEFYHPDDRPTIESAFERLRTEGESYDLELRLVTAKDRVRWVRTVGDPQYADGEIVGVLGIFQDITERKEREEELREVNERLDLAVEGGEIGIWDWNMRTDDVTFNNQWAEMLGFSLSELDSHLRTWENRVHPADMEHVEQQLNAHIAGETELYDCEHRMQTKDGEWRWVRDVGKVVEREDGEPTRAVGIHLDITEQKRSTLYLEEERDMFAQGPAVVFKWKNEDGWPVEYVSDNVTDTFGYTPDQLMSGTVPYTRLVHDDDLGRVAGEVDTQSDETTERFSHEPYRMVTSEGDVRWVTDNTKIIRNDGEITHYLGYLIDITDQKQFEQALRESEQSLRDLTDIASDADRSFEEKLATLLELGRKRLDVPYGFLNRLDDDTQHVVQAVGDHPEIQTGAEAPRSQTYCRKTVTEDGVLDVHDAVEEGWEGDPAYERFDLGCYIGGTVVVDGGQYGTLCFAGQASREKTFDDAERAFVELLVQWISYELAGNEFETKLQEMNDTAQRLMTAPSREEIGAITVESTKSVLDMSMNGLWWHDADSERLVPAGMTSEAATVVSDQPTLEPGGSLAYEAFERGESRLYDDLSEADGLYGEQSPLRSAVVVPLGGHGVMSAGSTEPGAFSETDLSLLEVLSATVEAALNRAQREETLRKTQQRLKQSNEELEQFAYVASHDLQEPLRTVSSYLTLLERRYAPQLDEDANEFIDFAVDGADRMREMIQALLAYSRVDTRGQSVEPVAVTALFERLQQDLTVTIEDADATVSTPETDLTVSGDPNQLSQLFRNLVENGITYNEGEPHIDISAEPAGEMVYFEVTDDGIGIDLDENDNIFEVFNRLHTREEFAGTGIGLSVCRKIVDRHGGEINVESEPGTGSTFSVTLPRAGEPDE